MVVLGSQGLPSEPRTHGERSPDCLGNRHKIATDRRYLWAHQQPAVDDVASDRSAYRGGRSNLEAAEIYIRQLTPGDAALYRSIRLAGLKESPEAFGST